MIYLANWDTGEVKQGLDIITLKRGEFCHSENYLCKRWKWSKGRVRRFIKWCQKDERCSIRRTITRTGQYRNVIQLVNYNKHQLPLKNGDNQVDNQVDTQDDTQTNNKPNNKPNNNIYEKIINDLNRLTGKNFKSTTKDYQKTISARMAEGYSVDDFLKVNNLKCLEWKNNPTYSKFLRPATLYCAKHFDTYLNGGVVQNIVNNGFTELYHSTLIKENSMKNVRSVVKQALKTMNREKAENYWNTISKEWRDDKVVKELFDSILN